MCRKLFWAYTAIVLASLLSACGDGNETAVDKLNEMSYAWHYRNLDSTQVYAQRALDLSSSYDDGHAEALNNLAFVSLAKMQYRQALRQLNEVQDNTDNQIELLVADVQLMRLCQRESRNKDFYDYRESAARRLRRIREEGTRLSAHQKRRMAYAVSEFHIVASTYFYYVGLVGQSADAIDQIDPDGSIRQDTAQMLCYWYNIGSGGIVKGKSKEATAQEEFEYLLRCYVASLQGNYPYWEAQALQGLSEHLQLSAQRRALIEANFHLVQYVNVDSMPDSLLAGYLAQRALDLFTRYGDVYQMAGANRTLAECYWQIRDYRSALICLTRALQQNKAINQAPDLVASICEQLCLVYSAVDDKVNSDRNRNIYLDLQEQTRQDRQLEARADQLRSSSRQLNVMLGAVMLMILVVVVLLFAFDRMRRRSDARFSLDTLLSPLRQWQKRNEKHNAEVEENFEELQEQMEVERRHLSQNRRRNLEQRAKIQLVNSVMPFIDRMANEVRRLLARTDTDAVRQQRYEYITELTDTINDYNNVLTQWIQMRSGDIRLSIESFPLQPLFDLARRSQTAFRLKGIALEVEPTGAVVKADRTLTLFMINTIADNARKFTPAGGRVTISAEQSEAYVEVSVADTGQGMTEAQCAHVFDRTYTGGHGFGLKNCYGIIEKYRKISRIFQVCEIRVESEPGKGSRFFFRLPKGIARLLASLMVLTAGVLGGTSSAQARPADAHAQAVRYADSAYFCNINGHYEHTLTYADSCWKYVSPNDTSVILDVSNEAAVAALALHRWDLYRRYNEIYTRLFREASTDSSLPSYVRTMLRSESNKVVAIILLVLLLIVIFPAYYYLYYRHLLNYRFCIDRVNRINRLLLEDIPDDRKLQGIETLGDFSQFDLTDAHKKNLTEIVDKIREALRVSIDRTSSQQATIELAGDELRCLKMETAKLHVSNSVLDNCLSTLKHETMYYPSRIRQLIDGSDDNLQSIAELTDYYQTLYAILSLQAMKQISPVRPDRDLTAYLFDLLRKLNGNVKPPMSLTARDARYAEATVVMTVLQLNEQQCHDLFTPGTVNLDFLLCRQITREMGEATNLRACGIAAELVDGVATVRIVMPAMCAKWVEQTENNDNNAYERL